SPTGGEEPVVVGGGHGLTVREPAVRGTVAGEVSSPRRRRLRFDRHFGTLPREAGNVREREMRRTIVLLVLTALVGASAVLAPGAGAGSGTGSTATFVN